MSYIGDTGVSLTSTEVSLIEALNALATSSATQAIQKTSATSFANVELNVSGAIWGQLTGTLSDQTDLQTALDAKLDDSQATVFGLSLLDDVNAAAGRTTLGLGTAAVVNTDLSDLNEATIEAAIDTLTNLTSIQGRTVTLVDAGANAFFGWDDLAGAYENLTSGEAFAILGVTASAAELNILDGATLSTTELNYVDGVTSAIQTQLDAKQPLDSDLTTIAGLTATTDNFIVSVSSAWASRTPAQVRTALALVIGTDVQAYDADLTTWAGITPATGIGTFLATPSSANLAAAVTDETGTGALVFANSPTLTTAELGSSTATTQSQSDNSTKIATTAYVDEAVIATNYKEACKYGSVAALPAIVYANGSSGVGRTLTGVALAAISLDGASPGVGDRVLIKNQVSDFQNGIYTVTQTGSGIAVFILTGAVDFDQSNEIKTGDATFITAGNTLANTLWAYTGIDSPTMGTTSLRQI